jgi:hypothetical protein
MKPFTGPHKSLLFNHLAKLGLEVMIVVVILFQYASLKKSKQVIASGFPLISRLRREKNRPTIWATRPQDRVADRFTVQQEEAVIRFDRPGLVVEARAGYTK